MNDLLLPYLMGNLILATPVALLAYLIQRNHGFARLAHVLWLFVLVKLLTPPLATLPILAVPVWSVQSQAKVETLKPVDFAIASPKKRSSSTRSPTSQIPTTPDRVTTNLNADRNLINIIQFCLITIWLSGTGWIILKSLSRIHQFHRLMKQTCRPGDSELQALTQEIAQRFALPRPPQIYTVLAQISPSVWWLGGRVKIIIPKAICDSATTDELRMIIAHELAHIKRRDHWVRWVEWLTCAVLWWNPLASWAGRNLRTNEEICCDAMVLNRLGISPRRYAGMLLKIIEFLAEPVIRPPVMACAVSSGGTMEQRFKMIIASKTLKQIPRWVCLGITMIGFLPLGFIYAQDFEAVERRLGEGVREGELSLSQAAAMLETLKRVSNQNGVMQRIREIERAIESRRISPVEGRNLIEETKRHLDREHEGEHRDRGDHREEQVRQRVQEIRRAIEGGKISPKEGRAMIEETRRHLDREHDGEHRDRGDHREEQVGQRIQEIERAIESGRISPEEGRSMIEETKRHLDREHEGEHRDRGDHREEQVRQRIQEIRRAIEGGKISPKEGRAMIEETKRHLDREHEGEHRDRGDHREERVKQRIQEIERAIENGRISPEEGRSMIEETKRHLDREHDGEHHDHGDHREEQVKQRIQEIRRAIEEGKISPEEGRRAIEKAGEAIKRQDSGEPQARREALLRI